jgi:tRNA U34 5-carboxymethylaminomethyl modifying GTPase MnmE/TrmE
VYTSGHIRLAKRGEFQQYSWRKRKLAMQRSRAIAIAAAEQKARQSRLIVAASLLLLPAALLLLLISP